MTLRTLNYVNYGILLIMGNAGFCPSAVLLLLFLLPTFLLLRLLFVLPVIILLLLLLPVLSLYVFWFLC